MGNKHRKHNALMRYGTIVKVNSFQTENGLYTIRIIKWGDEIYFHKMKNGVVVEIKNLTTAHGLEH